MSEVLVVYFSRTGSTERLARRVAALLQADLDRVTPQKAYEGGVGYLRAIWQTIFEGAPRIAYQCRPETYRLVVVVTPVWAGRLSAPIRSYLVQCGDHIDVVAAIWVSRSGGAYETVGGEIERLAGPLSAQASFSEAEARADEGERKLTEFATRVAHRDSSRPTRAKWP